METERKIYLTRKALGWSPEYLGSHLGISQRQYGRLESGECNITLKTLTVLCREWGITLNQLTGMSVEELSGLIRENRKGKPNTGSE